MQQKKQPDVNVGHERKLSDKEFSSHSSMLTNERVAILYSGADEAEIMAFTNFNLQFNKRYFAIVNRIFNVTFPIFTNEENQKIIEVKNAYLDELLSIDDSTKTDYKKLFVMYLFIERMNQLLTSFMQDRGYFFKLGTRESKSMDSALEVIEAGGGIFGKKHNLSDLEKIAKKEMPAGKK